MVYSPRYYPLNTSPYQNYKSNNLKNFESTTIKQTYGAPGCVNPNPPIINWSYLIWPNGWLLTPAIIGIIGGIILGLPERNPKTKTSRGSFLLIVNTYTVIATAGISFYVIKNLYMYLGHLGLTFTSIGIGITAAFLLFTSIFFYVYRVFPSTFKGDEIGEDVITQYFSFLYLSATAISVGPSGDILPVTSGSRMIMNIEVLYFLFVLSSGLAAFSQIR